MYLLLFRKTVTQFEMKHYSTVMDYAEYTPYTPNQNLTKEHVMMTFPFLLIVNLQHSTEKPVFFVENE